MTEIVEIDVGESINPIRGLRKAKTNGHKATFAEDTFLGMLSTCDVTARFLETTDQAFQIMIGARHERMCSGLKQMGRQGHSDRLDIGYSGQ